MTIKMSRQSTQPQQTAPRPHDRWLVTVCLFAPVLIALSITLRDLRVTFALASAVLALDAYVARKRRLHPVL